MVGPGTQRTSPAEPVRVVDCHVHVFDPARFRYAPDTHYAPPGQELGTPARLAGVLGVTLNAALLGVEYYADAGPLLAHVEALDMIADVQVIDDQLVALSPLLERSSVRVHVDHCGRPDPAAGIDAPGFRELLRWGRTGRAVVKLSGCVKVTREPYPHADLIPFIRALVSEFGPDHCVWASDWPFLRMPERIDYGPLLSLLAQQVPDEAARGRILWDTPCREFGFFHR